MYRFALRPRWILSHVLVVALVVVLILLGFWQLRRLGERQDRNALVEGRSEEPVAAIGDLVDADAPLTVGDDVRFRRAEAQGVFEPDSDVLVRNRTFDGQPGSWILATLRLDDGSALIVNRGWVPMTGEQEPTGAMTAPVDRVAVEGTVEATQEKGRFGSTDPADGTLRRVARVDVARLAEQIDGPTLPVWLQTTVEQPDPGDLPLAVEPPGLDEGNHFSYAMQWFTFAVIALVGYPLVLRRVARQTDEPPVDGAPPAWDDGEVVTES